MANSSVNTPDPTGSGTQGDYLFSQDGLKQAASNSAEKFSEYFDAATKELKKLETTLRASIEKNPLAVLGGAMAIGYLAGYLIKRVSTDTRSNSELISH